MSMTPRSLSNSSSHSNILTLSHSSHTASPSAAHLHTANIYYKQFISRLGFLFRVDTQDLDALYGKIVECVAEGEGTGGTVDVQELIELAGKIEQGHGVLRELVKVLDQRLRRGRDQRNQSEQRGQRVQREQRQKESQTEKREEGKKQQNNKEQTQQQQAEHTITQITPIKPSHNPNYQHLRSKYQPEPSPTEDYSVYFQDCLQLARQSVRTRQAPSQYESHLQRIMQQMTAIKSELRRIQESSEEGEHGSRVSLKVEEGERGLEQGVFRRVGENEYCLVDGQVDEEYYRMMQAEGEHVEAEGEMQVESTSDERASKEPKQLELSIKQQWKPQLQWRQQQMQQRLQQQQQQEDANYIISNVTIIDRLSPEHSPSPLLAPAPVSKADVIEHRNQHIRKYLTQIEASLSKDRKEHSLLTKESETLVSHCLNNSVYTDNQIVVGRYMLAQLAAKHAQGGMELSEVKQGAILIGVEEANHEPHSQAQLHQHLHQQQKTQVEQPVQQPQSPTAVTPADTYAQPLSQRSIQLRLPPVETPQQIIAKLSTDTLYEQTRNAESKMDLSPVSVSALAEQREPRLVGAEVERIKDSVESMFRKFRAAGSGVTEQVGMEESMSIERIGSHGIVTQGQMEQSPKPGVRAEKVESSFAIMSKQQRQVQQQKQQQQKQQKSPGFVLIQQQTPKNKVPGIRFSFADSPSKQATVEYNSSTPNQSQSNLSRGYPLIRNAAVTESYMVRPSPIKLTSMPTSVHVKENAQAPLGNSRGLQQLSGQNFYSNGSVVLRLTPSKERHRVNSLTKSSQPTANLRVFVPNRNHPVFRQITSPVRASQPSTGAILTATTPRPPPRQPPSTLQSIVSPINLLQHSRSEDRIKLHLAKNLSSTPPPTPTFTPSRTCISFRPPSEVYVPVPVNKARAPVQRQTPKFCESQSGHSEQEMSFSLHGLGSRSRSRGRGIRVMSKEHSQSSK